MISPPRPPQDEPELLIREAREQQRRRQWTAAAVVALAAASGMSVWAAIPGRGGGAAKPSGAPRAGAARGIEASGRVRITAFGTSGGVTWAINGHGMWLSRNDGRSWRASTPSDLRRVGSYGSELWQRAPEVSFFDRQHGWLLAEDVGGLPARTRQAVFETTSDGGRTWHRSTPRGCCGEFTFLDRRVGFFAGSSRLYETRNGGATWNAVGGRFFGSPLIFLDARHGVAMLDGGFLQTSDGGMHWTSPLLSGAPPAAGNPTIVGSPVERAGGRLVLIAEHDFDKQMYPGDWRSIPYVSDDGGTTWTARPPLPSGLTPYSNGHGNDLSAVRPGIWFLAARRELGVTTDSGQTWKPVQPVDLPAGWTIASIDFTSPNLGWAIFTGPERRSVLVRTTDGGVHWTPAGPRAPRHRKR